MDISFVIVAALTGTAVMGFTLAIAFLHFYRRTEMAISVLYEIAEGNRSIEIPSPERFSGIQRDLFYAIKVAYEIMIKNESDNANQEHQIYELHGRLEAAYEEIDKLNDAAANKDTTIGDVLEKPVN